MVKSLVFIVDHHEEFGPNGGGFIAPHAHEGGVQLNPAFVRIAKATALLVPADIGPTPYCPKSFGSPLYAFCARASLSHELPGMSEHFASLAYLS
jgi:hypothetical protein